jgi:hypothetical protein
VAGLVITAIGTAQAADRAPARSAAPGLHVTATVALGRTSNMFRNVFTEAPNGALFYSRGSVVYLVTRHSAPRVALRASRRVLALAANSSDLFVQTGLTVTAYRRSNGSKVRQWSLTSPVIPITSAGLLVVGRTLWSWTDWATDRSGFEFARISRINTSAGAVHVVGRQGYPADMAADASGLYFEEAHGSANAGYLAHSTPAGVIRIRRQANVDAPMALAAGRLELLSFHSNGHNYLDTYRTSLLRISASRISDNDRMIAGTGSGLLVLTQPCSSLTCSSASVSKLASDGSVSGTLGVPYAFTLVTGPSAAVIAVRHGTMYLVRIAA